MAMGGKQNGGDVVVADRQQITGYTKTVFMVFGFVMLVSTLLLGWKAYDQSAWLPMPTPGAFMGYVILIYLMWVMWVISIPVIGKR